MADAAARGPEPTTPSEQEALDVRDTTESREPNKRQRSKPWKALQNATQAKPQELWDQANELHKISDDVYDAPDNIDALKEVLRSCRTALAAS